MYRANIGRLLEEDALDPRLGKGDSAGEPADATADDDWLKPAICHGVRGISQAD